VAGNLLSFELPDEIPSVKKPVWGLNLVRSSGGNGGSTDGDPFFQKIFQRVEYPALAFAICLSGACFLQWGSLRGFSADEGVQYESKAGAVFEYLTMHPFNIITQKMEKISLGPCKTRFLSRTERDQFGDIFEQIQKAVGGSVS
jgi:hypothetical protein